MAQKEQDDRLFIARAEDALRIAEKRCGVKTLGFLNPHQRLVIRQNVLPPAGMKMDFDGGWPEAERTLLVCYPEYLSPERSEYLCLLECTGRELHGLSHRDYLGSLMGLGITREKLGDILVLEDRAMLFVLPDIAEYILQNLTKIGNCGVRLKEIAPDRAEIPPRPVKEITGTVSSLRLDSVTALAAGVSRAKAAEMIRGGLVSVNWEPEEDVAKPLREGDMLSVRGVGRIRLSRVGGTTKKGRYSVSVARYI